MNIIIRKMDYEDTSQVQNIAKTTWNATYEGIIPLEVQNKFLKSAYNDEMMKRRLERSIVYVAEVENKVVGFANYSTVREGGIVELAAIYLYPEFQGKGIGTALLQQAIEELDGIKEIYINVEKKNMIGLTFYKAKGFEIVKEFDDEFEGHILKTVRMVMKI
ncbi:GNAT family N-acetyltransferase [Ureibacillus manganicus]|uniref:GNAT family acetyltransferase n=1 Tax=Ureibacillus manganicus DSM 26584 TaxID=1384049 RepID=A0A0A3HY48_9BACL|nr:GNAT family N-acetyltransferase [Ureibacillus manganicus]KGR77359.1 GNAT family acetyltransferase [Ureibacillus manganicus DSM 26584]